VCCEYSSSCSTVSKENFKAEQVRGIRCMDSKKEKMKQALDEPTVEQATVASEILQYEVDDQSVEQTSDVKLEFFSKSKLGN